MPNGNRENDKFVRQIEEIKNTNMEKLIDRFLRYVSIETTSNPDSGLHPSSDNQKDFAKTLAQELEHIGMVNVSISDKSYVTATLPANTSKDVPTVGFIAHMDTSPDFTAKNVTPMIINDYNGGEILLNCDNDVVLSPNESPELLNYIGDTIITTNGNTLLGADDKAGIAEIVSAMEALIADPKIEHGKIVVCFTPDEEIGEGADFFDVKTFGADFAYTIDGGEIGELEYENFNAASAKVTICGRSVHPGYAKGKMINSILIAQRFMNLMPDGEVPEKSENREGFFHLMKMTGNVETSVLEFILRDHDRERFEERKKLMQIITNQINKELEEERVSVEIKDQYYNMIEKIKPNFHIIEIAINAMNNCDIKPKIEAIRGGTDGARLSFEGLPCPNIFCGVHNMHGRYEFVPLNSMKKAVEVIIEIAKEVVPLSK